MCKYNTIKNTSSSVPEATAEDALSYLLEETLHLIQQALAAELSFFSEHISLAILGASVEKHLCAYRDDINNIHHLYFI